MHICWKDHVRQIADTFLVGGALLVSAPVALAATDNGSAGASVAIVEPVGAGISFDILSDAVSAVFLNGDAGDSVSVLMTNRKPGAKDTPRKDGGVLVMASGVYRIDLLQTAASNSRLRGQMPGSGSILFLAQFN